MNFSQLGFGFFVLKINGVLLAGIFLLVAWHYFRQIIRKNFSVDFFVHHFWKWILGGLLVGRLVALALDPEIFLRHGMWAPAVFWDGEVSFWGMFLGGFSMMAWDLKKQQLSFWRWIDLAIPSLMIGVVLMDVIQFFTGAIYGTETTLPWGIQYETFGVETLSAVHPVTLYVILPHIVLLNWALKKQTLWERQPGRLSFLIGLWLFVIQFFIEFLYGNKSIMLGESFRVGQALSLIMVIFCVVGLIRRK
jgi:prolipoprotein diacylglyceryltransferase